MECAICCDTIVNSVSTTILSCNHAFHIKCISEWIIINPSCPCCRKCLAPVEAYYASIEARPIVPPAVDTTRYNMVSSPPRIYRRPISNNDVLDPLWPGIPNIYHKYVLSISRRLYTDQYTAFNKIKKIVVKIQAISRGYLSRSMCARVLANTWF
jgi:hypothetical protein